MSMVRDPGSKTTAHITRSHSRDASRERACNVHHFRVNDATDMTPARYQRELGITASRVPLKTVR